ncbi:hypothetical protein QNI19_07580 [Cytophagaceae bacterium DM2B3-1]|uniref:Outer membrane protein beta-barrel domain-containing protein n=1 Tax=Xanthocytophaga flava TaxID=3048013 RepID=A0ABT7CGG9_9BACT|nr:hypothetical protein [Xanthocytophaga flavus]MDJ1472004.1 hypothetical protein [Xanthocytophaga flavus]MDJ1492788.1 hypothetical protein [Xanthocytophaga flavus]
MKKVTILACALFAMMTPALVKAQSETYKLFKVDVGAGYGFGKAKGVLFYAEPKFNLHDNFAAGLRFEGAILGNVSGNDQYASADISAIGSYALTGDYYVGTNGFRPFGGLGVGLFNMGSVSVDSETTEVPEMNVGTKFGVVPRIGFEAGHFRMGLEYNLITGQPSDFNRNYFSLKLGAVIGGGKK